MLSDVVVSSTHTVAVESTNSAVRFDHIGIELKNVVSNPALGELEADEANKHPVQTSVRVKNTSTPEIGLFPRYGLGL